MATKRISPQETQDLVQQGWTYVDVRSAPEFQGGRPKGAVNVPLMDQGPGGMTPNPNFLETMKAKFPPGSKIVLGCLGGSRSMKAAAMLESAGWGDLVEQRAGWGGAKDASGRVVEAGWLAAGLPTEK